MWRRQQAARSNNANFCGDGIEAAPNVPDEPPLRNESDRGLDKDQRDDDDSQRNSDYQLGRG
jgi:hypothetical protein